MRGALHSSAYKKERISESLRLRVLGLKKITCLCPDYFADCSRKRSNFETRKAKIVCRFLAILLVAVAFLCAAPDRPQAASQAECAIWICLPGGFPSGCSAAYSAFHHRIKRELPPLPALSSCTTGPDGIGTNGRYELGYEAFEVCKEGYKSGLIGMCIPSKCGIGQFQPGQGGCLGYEATRKTQPHYIKIWVKGEYVGQFWY